MICFIIPNSSTYFWLESALSALCFLGVLGGIFAALSIGLKLPKILATRTRRRLQELKATSDSILSSITETDPLLVEYRKIQHGITMLAVGLVLMACGFLIYQQHQRTRVGELDNLTVTGRVDDYRYFMADANGGELYTKFCNDYAPPMFRVGMTLTRLIFVDYDECWSLNPNKHAGYFIKRDGKGQVIYAKE